MTTGLVGVTWSPTSTAAGVRVEVRYLTADVWSDWTELEVETGETGEAGIPGTQPLWVGSADGVAARVVSTSGTLRDLEISTIDSGTDDEEASVSASPSAYRGPADGVARATTVATSDGSPSFPSMPTIIRRSAWGASSGSYCSSPQVGSTTMGVVIHHTAGSNSYSASDSKSLVRGIQAYHTKSRGWCDIGYNFLVDRFGQVFEGRKGGIDRNVRAAHSGNNAVNTYTTGISLMGNLDDVKPSTLMQAAVVKLAGWRLGTTYLAAKGKYSLGGKSLNMVAGHRDVVGTGCPGGYGYAWLSQSGGLRDRVEDYLSKMDSEIKTRAKSLGTSTTGLVFSGESGTLGGRKTRFDKVDMYSKPGLGAAKYVSEAGGFRSRYAAFGSQTSKLGFPTSDSPRTSSSQVTAQTFQTGSIYDVPSKGTFAVWGATDALYRDLDGPSGDLGDPRASSSSTRTTFEKGYIVVDSSGEKATAYTTSGGQIGTTDSRPSVGTVGPLSASSTSSTATFSWSKVSGATSYRVCLMFDYSSTSCARTVTVSGTSVKFSSLKPTQYTDYVGKVRALNGSTEGDWSKPKGVNLAQAEASAAPPATVGPLSASSTSSTATFSWSKVSGATSYRVCLMFDYSSTSCARTVTVSGTSVKFSSLKPTQYTDYVGKVRALNGSAEGEWSRPKGVNLTTTEPVGRVGTLSSSSTTSTATFSWSTVSRATSYEVCLMFDYSSTSCARTVTVSGTSVKFSGLKPTQYTDYVGKVRARQGSSSGEWSPPKGVNLKAAAPASSSSVTVPSSGTISISGHGYGHGIGMSQYGAQGAAREGLDHTEILAHYYPGTSMATKSGNIRVLISAQTSDATIVVAQSGLKFYDVTGKRWFTLPASIGGSTVKRWQMVPYSSGSSRTKLRYQTSGGYVTYRDDAGDLVSWTGEGQFYRGSSTISLVLPNGSTMNLRGFVRSAKPSSGSGTRDTVNSLSIDDYVRGVIAAEMPASWHTEALQSQAVAARTYGVRSISGSKHYDICSTTACQVYGGASRETSTTDAAVRATAGEILTYGGSPAFTQFSSSSGGYSAVGSQPYLKAVADPYDGWSGNANHAWKVSVKASTIQKANPSIGTLKKMTITKRNGYGSYGGRVESVTLYGSSKTVTISGNDARWDFGLKSNWFTF